MRRWAQLVALTAFALAQPLYDLLGKNPEFFSVRGATRAEIVVFALALLLLPPTALWGVEELGGRWRRELHLLFVAGLAASIALQALRTVGGPYVPLVLAVALGVAAALAVRRLRALESTLTVLAAAAPLFLGLFLLDSPTAKLIRPASANAQLGDVRSTTPVVLVVLDEFPTGSLQDRRHLIDPVRFPHFAALGRGATWYRNATTVHEGTTQAVPAILTGRVSRPGAQPRFADHRQNLFTLLGGSYELDVFERDTRLCPPHVCREHLETSFGGQLRSLTVDSSLVYAHLLLPDRLARGLPSVSESWQDFLERGQDEAARFGDFLAALRPSSRPTLHVIHALLPHSPWQYLPSGRRYDLRYPVAPWGPDEVWSSDRGLVLQSEQRHLLQVAVVDRLVGRLVARLRDTGLYDRSLVVVTADHGIAFQPGEKRRPVWPENLEEIAYVPLFVKLPHQTRGRIDDSHAQTIDVVPTIAAGLGARLPWPVDGRSLPGRGSGRAGVDVRKGSGQEVKASLAALNRRRYATVARRLALFGEHTPPASLFGVGAYRRFLNKRPNIAELAATSRARVVLDSGRSPFEISGRVVGSTRVHDVAVVAGGRVVAVVPVFGARLWALTPRRLARFELLALSGRASHPRFARLSAQG